MTKVELMFQQATEAIKKHQHEAHPAVFSYCLCFNDNLEKEVKDYLKENYYRVEELWTPYDKGIIYIGTAYVSLTGRCADSYKAQVWIGRNCDSKLIDIK